MVLKRNFDGGEGLGEFPVQESSKRRQTIIDNWVTNGLSEKQFFERIEPLLRKVVREEFERVFSQITHLLPTSSLNQINTSGSRGWQLQFRSKFRRTLFTGSKIYAVDGEPVQIVVVDANTKEIVTTGPLSSLKVSILVLDGDFGSDAKDDWSEQEFNACVIRERDGRRPLVTGELQITLRNGVGYFGDLIFTDNSSWTRGRKFRLGAKIVSSNNEHEGIREARSEPFIVKDHRGEVYKKHYPPSPNDDVWRLEKIGKDGAFHHRLTANQVNNVQDLLRWLVTNPSNLRSILGSGMSNRTWEIITQHAKTCLLDNRHYMYQFYGRQVALIFDSVYNLIGVKFDGQTYNSLGNLDASQVMLVQGLKRQAYQNLNEMVEIDWTSVDDSSLVLPLQGSSLPGPSLGPQLPPFAIIHEDQEAAQRGPNMPYIMEDRHDQWEEISGMQCDCTGKYYSSVQRNSFKMKGPLVTYSSELNQWDSGESSDSVGMGGHVPRDDASQVHFADWFSTWESGSGIFMASGDEMGFDFVPDLSMYMTTKSSKPNKGWFTIRAAVKWVISGRRVLAAKRRQSFMQLAY
ncbi:hypothetical protein ACHQM5_026360 [Ranunculus cassubicifolius]